MPANETHPSRGNNAAAKPASGGSELAISAEAREYQGHSYMMITLVGQATDEARRPLREALTTRPTSHLGTCLSTCPT
jgi:hypothetical protein